MNLHASLGSIGESLSRSPSCGVASHIGENIRHEPHPYDSFTPDLVILVIVHFLAMAETISKSSEARSSPSLEEKKQGNGDTQT